MSSEDSPARNMAIPYGEIGAPTFSRQKTIPSETSLVAYSMIATASCHGTPQAVSIARWQNIANIPCTQSASSVLPSYTKEILIGITASSIVLVPNKHRTRAPRSNGVANLGTSSQPDYWLPSHADPRSERTCRLCQSMGSAAAGAKLISEAVSDAMMEKTGGTFFGVGI
jgi:hypothetical protein